MSLHQDLYGNNFLKRVNNCNWIRRKMRTCVSFLSHVLFSDEANFANTGSVNRHNMHYWCIVGDHVIGPNFFEGPLTGQVYANFLQNVLPQLMKDVLLHVRMNMWIQHEGAPQHHVLYSRQVMN